ncbi:MAG: hypothetical protein P1P74_09690 [Desulfuromonadales bacterium]|nr:hypothetical protein [Desulfuromonadales bacterium]
MKKTTRILFSLLLTIGLVLTGVSTVWAAVAANTQIINEATLSYGTGTNTKTAKASVTVTVSLVSALSTVVGTGDKLTPYAQTDTPLTLQFTVTANSNGPETYTVAASNGTTTNTTSPTDPLVPVPFILGATVTTSGSTTTVINVPADGTSDNSVNGLEVGDTVVINGEVRTITAITDNASGISTITLDSALTTAPNTGVPVQEQKLIDVTAYSGTVQSVGDDVVVPVDLTVTNTAGTTATVTQNATYSTGQGTLTKFVRNVTNAVGNSGGGGAQAFTFNSATATYYSSGVTGEAGDVLEYVLVAQNTGTGIIPNTRIDDKVPLQYVTLGTGAYGGKDVLHRDENNTETTLTLAADGDAASIIPPGDLLVVYTGTGAAAGTGGTIGGGKSVLIAYRVSIK